MNRFIMDAIVFYPENEDQFKRLMSLAGDFHVKILTLNEDEKRKLAGILLGGLAKKNPGANATMDEIISLVEEVRAENFYGKKDNNS